jgi:hypothetical protein
MGTAFLELTNKVIRKLNQVELTSANFSSATGFQALAKDLVQEAIDDINQAVTQWPFNHSTGTITTVSGTQTYSLASDNKVTDWKTFYLNEDASLEVSSKPLSVIEYLEWHNRLRANDQLATAGSVNIPSQIYRTRDLKIGVTPIPDRAYTITYEYWKNPDRLSSATSTTLIPKEYDRVIVAFAMQGAYDFRENYEMAAKEYQKYKKGLADMKRTLVPQEITYAYDTRTRSRSRRDGWSK